MIVIKKIILKKNHEKKKMKIIAVAIVCNKKRYPKRLPFVSIWLCIVLCKRMKNKKIVAFENETARRIRTSIKM